MYWLGGANMNENEYRRPAVVRTDSEPAPETDWNAVYQAQQSDESKPEGGFLNNGFAKIGCGCLLPALMMLGTCAGTTNNASIGPEFMPSYVAGTIIGGLLLCWGPVFAFWLRDQSKWIIGASFIVFAVIFGVGALSKIGGERQKLLDDMSVINDVKFDKDGNAILADGSNPKGPFGKMMVEMIAERDKIFADYEASRAALGINQLFMAADLKKNPKVINNCQGILSLEGKVTEARTKSKAMLEGLRQKVEAMDYSAAIKADMLRGIGASQSANFSIVDKQWDIQQRSITPTYRACTMLAKRQWTNKGQDFIFNSTADMNIFNESVKTLNALDAEAVTLMKNHSDGLKAKKENLNNIMDDMKGK
jgi:hypothetical protein